jgi:hypothetical protein
MSLVTEEDVLRMYLELGGRKSPLKISYGLKRDNLRKALRALENKCLTPKGTLTTSEAEKLWSDSEGDFDFHRRALEGKVTFWPLKDELRKLDQAVIDLAVICRKKHFPPWKSYKAVNVRWPGIRLVPRVQALVKRARKILKDIGGSGIERLKREADAGVPEAIQLRKDLNDLLAFRRDPSNAPEIKWQDTETSMKCYTRAVELVVDELRWQPLLERAQPLLRWIAFLGNRDFVDLLRFDDVTERTTTRMASRNAAKIVKRKREQAKQRQAKRRLKVKEDENRT